jgi:hypothetical protein
MSKNIPQASSGNVCIRCGKMRIFKESWQEKSDSSQGQSTATYSMFVCPDPECQKLVEKSLAEKQKVAQERQEAQDKRMQGRNNARTQATGKN